MTIIEPTKVSSRDPVKAKDTVQEIHGYSVVTYWTITTVSLIHFQLTSRMKNINTEENCILYILL